MELHIQVSIIILLYANMATKNWIREINSKTTQPILTKIAKDVFGDD